MSRPLLHACRSVSSASGNRLAVGRYRKGAAVRLRDRDRLTGDHKRARRGGPVSAAAEKVTVPEPLPLDPAVIVSQGWVLDALHSHPAVVVTLTARVPPLASTLWESGETSKEQPGDWVTANDCPAIVSDAVRDGPAVDATVTVTLPGPRQPVASP